MTYKTLKTNIERELILTLVLGMKQKRISEDRAKKISKAILEIVKGSSENNVLLNEISKICPMYPEIMDSYIKTAKEYEKESSENKLSQMSFYLKKGQVDEALASAKEVN